MASATSASATTQRARQLLAGARMLAELGHGDAAQGQRWRVVAQGDPLERAERVAGREGARGYGDQGVHEDRLLLMPTCRASAVK